VDGIVKENLFDLSGRVAVITGGAGFLGIRHAEAVVWAGGRPVLLDLPDAEPGHAARSLAARLATEVFSVEADVTDLASLERARDTILSRFGRLDILVNNAARNPRVENADIAWSRLEEFSLDTWNADVSVGLTGAFLCSQVFGTEMVRRGGGVIVNVSSDLGLIGPDQRIYRRKDLPEDRQPVKPVTYSVVKSGLIGLTRYLATYWADKGVRANTLSPGGVLNNQPNDFVERLSRLIPLGRMAFPDEYMGALVFLCSDASSYMTGANLVVDGGRTCW
jgi:NAD(P)-dependent dehydrogenase (short-subunit alcohol dehydrogenase family)